MSIHNTKTRLNILDTNGAQWVMVDLLKMFDEETNGRVENDVYYALFVQKLKVRLQNKLNILLQEIKEGCRQIDLEDSIKEINEERKTK